MNLSPLFIATVIAPILADLSSEMLAKQPFDNISKSISKTRPPTSHSEERSLFARNLCLLRVLTLCLFFSS